MFLGQPCCICIKKDDFGLKGSETDVAGILAFNIKTTAVIISIFYESEPRSD